MTSAATTPFQVPAQLPARGAEPPVLEMVLPLLGFPEHRRFVLARLDETGLLCALSSVDQPDLSFVVVPPAVFFPEYAPEVEAEVIEALGARSAEDLLLLTILTLGRLPRDATANLLAPLLVDHRTRRVAQVLLDDPGLPLRAPLARR